MVALGRPRRASANSVARCEPFSSAPSALPPRYADLLEVLVGRGDLEGLAVVVDAHEEHDLVARSVEVELQVRVLVGAAAGPHRRLPVLDQAARPVVALPRLSPQSWQNQSPAARAARVGHQDHDATRRACTPA